MPFTQEMPSDCTACLGRCKAPDGCAQHRLDLTAKVKKKKPPKLPDDISFNHEWSMQKYFRPLLTYDIKGSFISNSDWSAQCYTNALYVSFFYLWWNIYRVIFFFFLSPLWQKAESLRNSNFLLVPGGRGQGSHKPSDRRDCHPAQEQKLCVPYLRAAFLSQLYRMISRFGDAWKINCVSLLCIVRTKVGVRFLFRVGEGIGMTNFSSGRFEPEQTWSFGG